MRVPTLAVLSALALGCGGDDAPETADATSSSSCTHNGLATDTQGGERDDDIGVFFYTAFAGDEPQLEKLTLDFYFPFGAADGPHELTFTGENLRTCHTCLMVRRNCESPRCADGKAFLVQSGSASITALGAAGTSFEGTLSNAVFAEVTIAISEGEVETTLVPDGETWCIDSLAFDSAITAP